MNQETSYGGEEHNGKWLLLNQIRWTFFVIGGNMNKVKPLGLEYVVKCSEKGDTEVSLCKLWGRNIRTEIAGIWNWNGCKIRTTGSFVNSFHLMSVSFLNQFSEVINEITIVAELEISVQTGVFGKYTHYQN